MTKQTTYTVGQLALYEGAPALVISVPEGRPSVILKLAHNHYKSVIKAEVQPYNGKEDALSLGLTTED